MGIEKDFLRKEVRPRTPDSLTRRDLLIPVAGLLANWPHNTCKTKGSDPG